MRNWERCTLCPWRITFFSRHLYMGIHCFSFRFPWKSISTVPDFLVYLNTHCLLWKISLFPFGFAVCFSTFHDSLNTYCLFQTFRWLLHISLKIPCLLLQISLFTWILTVCCSRCPWMFTSSPKSYLFPERLTTCSKCSKSESEEVKVAADTFLWTYLYRVPDISINL